MLLSIVIPAYNEQKIIKNTLKKVIKYLSDKNYFWEIIVSDDGSRDRTVEIVKDFRNKHIKIVSLKHNCGKGAALRNGILHSKGDYVIFMDADLSVPLKNIDIFLKKLEQGNQVVIASRRIKGAKIEIHQPWHRENMGRVFTFITKRITGVNVSDFTCGFKGFSKTAAHMIFKHSVIDRWAYDAEIVFLANKYNYKINEIPIRWRNRQDTRVRLKQVVFESFRDLLRIRINDALSKY